MTPISRKAKETTLLQATSSRPKPTTTTRCGQSNQSGLQAEVPTRPCRQCGRPVKAFVVEMTGTVLSPSFCPACEAEREQERQVAEQTAREMQRCKRQDQIVKLLTWTGVPNRYLGCSLENFQGAKPPERPVMLLGPPGTGKTHLAVAYLRAWILEHDDGACFSRILDLMRRLRRGDDFGEDLVHRLGRKVRFLVLDDLGTEMATDFALQSIYDIVDLRYSYDLPLVITSNLSIRKIGSMYGTNFISRLRGLGEVVELKGPDYRLLASEVLKEREHSQNMH